MVLNSYIKGGDKLVLSNEEVTDVLDVSVKEKSYPVKTYNLSVDENTGLTNLERMKEEIEKLIEEYSEDAIFMGKISIGFTTKSTLKSLRLC